MKKFISILCFASGLWAQTSAAGDFGLGIILGNPTGVTVKNYFSKTTAVDGALGASFGDGDFHIHGDYLLIVPNIFQVDRHPFDFYWGIGARMITWDDDHYHDHHHKNGHHHDHDLSFGPRVPAGLSFTLKKPVIEFFLELALVLDILPHTDADLDLALGGRFYF